MTTPSTERSPGGSRSPARSGSVLIVEDDEALCSLLAEEVEDAGYDVITAQSAEEAQALLERDSPELVVSDLRLPGADGRALLGYTRSLDAPPAFLVITAFGTVSQAVECLKMGADDFLTKPLDLDHLMVSVRRALETRRLRRQVQQLRGLLHGDDFHGMIGRSRPMRVLFEQIQHVGRASGAILVTGESGVGKELVAHAVHEESTRAGAPFIAVNCAGIPTELLESEFFGHMAGAFTGAARARKGLFEEAHGGTLFLDEIAEMPAALQAKLLRVLQDGGIRPVGGNRERPVDVRVVAATNRDLPEEIRRGRFREDLFYRLETFVLAVPPLRERGEDIELLAARFLHRYSLQMGRNIAGMAAEVQRRLREYHFPGNVRELQNAMERAVAFCHGDRIRLEHLPSRMRIPITAAGTGYWAEGGPGVLLAGDALLPLSEVTRRYIDHVLERVGGNKRQAAKLLGIGRRTLYRRLGEEEASRPDPD